MTTSGILTLLLVSLVIVAAVVTRANAGSPIEVRWTRADVDGWALAETEKIEFRACDQPGTDLCGAEVLADGSCGDDVIRVHWISPGIAEGTYAHPLRQRDTESAKALEGRTSAITLRKTNGNLLIRVTPSVMVQMMARTSLDNVTVVYKPDGSARCEPTS